MKIAVTLGSKHIKGSPHTISLFTKRELQTENVVIVVCSVTLSVFMAFVLYRAVNKNADRSGLQEEATEARRCLMPLALDLIDIASDGGKFHFWCLVYAVALHFSFSSPFSNNLVPLHLT